jgi:hypothetical protein
MKRMIGIFISVLFLANSLSVITHENTIVIADATPPVPKIEESYIYNLTYWLSQVINRSYGDNELAKGRAFGTKGEHDAAEKLVYEMEYNLSLYDPTEEYYSDLPYREKMENISSRFLDLEKNKYFDNLTTKLETLYQNLTINHSGNITYVDDFYIHPRWNTSSPYLRYYCDLIPFINIPTYNKQLLTNNFSYFELSIVKRPKFKWWGDIISSKISEIVDILCSNETSENLTLNDYDTFFITVCKEFEKNYSFSFADLLENPENISSLPWYNETLFNGTSDFVCIAEDPFFNNNAYLPPSVKLLNKINPLADIPGHYYHKAKISLQMFFWWCHNQCPWLNSDCLGLILYDSNNNTNNMEPLLYPAFPVLFINRSIGINISKNLSDYSINFTINQRYNESAESYNVIGQINGTSGKTVIVCAYYDSWWNQGVVDGAIPMATVLALAKYMKELNDNYSITPKHNVKFIGFCAEEYGFRGAYYYEAYHDDEDIVAVIDLNQMGFTQEDPSHNLDMHVVTNKLWFMPFLIDITDKIRYEDRLGDGTGLKVVYKAYGSQANDKPFAKRSFPFGKNKTVNFLKDTNWTRHHRDGRENGTGDRHTEGDVMKYYYPDDVNLTAEMAWNVTKYFAINPDCWLEGETSYELWDSDDKGDDDTFNVSFSLNTSMPSDRASVRLVLFPKFTFKNPCFPIRYRLRDEKEYVVTPTGIDGYINISIPNHFPAGKYIAKLYLCDSTNDVILDVIDQGIAVTGLELLSYIRDLIDIDVLAKLTPKIGEILEETRLNIIDEIKRLDNCNKLRNSLTDFLGYYCLADDNKAFKGIVLAPPNKPPNKPDTPLGETDVEARQWYEYKTKTTDPDSGDKIRYQWDWGSGIPGCWSVKQYNPGIYHYKDHAWLFSGNKEIRVRAKNPRSPNVFSNWSETLSVTASSTGCTFNIYTSQTNQININNLNSLNSFDNKAVVRGHDTNYNGDYYGFLETPTCDYNFSGLQTHSGSPDTTYPFNDSGIKYVNFTADDNGTIAYYNTTINVVNISPCFNMNQFGAQPNKTVNFTDTTISNQTIVNCTWNLGDGNISYEQNVSHNYSTTGAYNVTLTVKDANSEEATFWQIVPIETDPPEFIDATYYPIPGTLGCNMTLCAELFDDNGSGINTVTVNISYPNGTANNFTMIEDENNSYGYKYVFNDTMQVGWYFFDIWVNDSANNSNNFAGCGFEIQPAFGNSTIGNQSKNINDNISGSNFTVLANGTAESISAFIHANLSTPPKTKCMIYRVNDSTLIGTTEEKTVNTGDEPDWVTYNFTTSKPNLTTNTQYILACWSNDTCNLSYHNASDDSYGKYLSYTYGTPPNSIVNGTNESRIYSIFCNYSTIPFIKSSSASPNPIGFGYNTTITAEVEHYFTLVENITVNITYPNSTYVNYSMNQVDDDTFQYTTETLWKVDQYNYTIWVKDKLGGNSTNTGYSFNVSAQATITVSTIKDSYGDNKTVNLTDPPGEPPLISYELLDDGDVLHIWNTFDNYYFDTDSGIQLTNHYNEYWSHNVLMLGYYNNDKWNLMYRTDELSGFNKDIKTDNETYVNVTLWKNLEYYGYDFRLAIRYCLGVDDNELTVIPYIKNIDQSGIPYVLGFGWEMKDIQIDMTTTGDYIDVNNTMYYLNQTLNNTYTDLSESEFYLMENITDSSTKSLYLKWNDSLNYKLQVKSREGQYNAPVTLFMRIGTLASGQEKHTKMYWYDANQVTFYFNSYDNGEAWATNPSYMVDGNVFNYTTTTTDGDIELCNGNNCSGSDIGEISAVEIRLRAYYSGGFRYIFLRPVFGGSTDGLNQQYAPTTIPGVWSPWYEITRDPYAPGTWTWTDVDNLDCDVEVVNDPMGPPFTIFCSQVEIRVTYAPYNPPEPSIPYPSNGSNGISLTPTLNITVSDGDGDLMNITWLSNSSGSWQVFGTNTSVSNGTYHQIFSNATENGKWWYWRVNVTDGQNYTVSSVYKFYTGYQSKIINTGNTSFKGYLLIQVQYYNTTSENWTVANNTINETTIRSIDTDDPGGTGNTLALDTIFNGLVNTSNLSAYGNGTYRIYAAFRDPEGEVLVCDDDTELKATYEFTITFD